MSSKYQLAGLFTRTMTRSCHYILLGKLMMKEPRQGMHVWKKKQHKIYSRVSSHSFRYKCVDQCGREYEEWRVLPLRRSQRKDLIEWKPKFWSLNPINSKLCKKRRNKVYSLNLINYPLIFSQSQWRRKPRFSILKKGHYPVQVPHMQGPRRV